MPSDVLLSVRGLGKVYARNGWLRRDPNPGWAIRDVNLDLESGRTLAIVGNSGSGKSTLARCISLFEQPTCGEICLQGRRIAGAGVQASARMNTDIQLIFQQPAATLTPRFTGEEAVAEPFVIRKWGNRELRAERARELMALAGLPPHVINQRALELSGGERQRLAIARALALQPKLLILDESLAGLDLSIQGQIVNLLLDLQERLGLTYILISHDLELVSGLADEIAVMEGGAIVEHRAAAELLASPQHSRTRELLKAALALGPGGTV